MAEEKRKFMKSDSSYDESFRAEYLHPRYWGLWLLAPLLFIFAWMPVCLRDAIGRLIGSLVLKFSGRQSEVAMVNLRIMRKELTDPERREIIRKSVQIGMCGLLAYGEPFFLPKSMLMRRWNPVGKEYLDEAVKSGKTIIFMIPHTWTIDCCGLYLSAIGLPMTTMMHSSRNDLMDWYMNRLRLRFGGKVFERGASLRPVIRSLREGNHFYYLPDEDLGKDYPSLFVPLFGTRKATLDMLPKLAKVSGAAVVPMLATYNMKTRRYDVVFERMYDNFPSGGNTADAARMNRSIESLLEGRIEQYMLFLRFYQTRPEGEKWEPYYWLSRQRWRARLAGGKPDDPAVYTMPEDEGGGKVRI